METTQACHFGESVERERIGDVFLDVVARGGGKGLAAVICSAIEFLDEHGDEDSAFEFGNGHHSRLVGKNPAKDFTDASVVVSGADDAFGRTVYGGIKAKVEMLVGFLGIADFAVPDTSRIKERVACGSGDFAIRTSHVQDSALD